MATVVLSYKLKLFPTRVKADTLALLSSLFRQSHTVATQLLAQEEGRPPSTKGMGEFIGRAYRRAYIDYRRITKAGHTPGFLKAELIDSADLQRPKKATGFDYWILLKGTKDKLYIPARGHRGLNRALALPGSELNTGTKGSASVMRKHGKWYAYVTVKVPLAEVQQPNGWLGCDVGARAAVTRSDGYQGPDLRPILKRHIQRRADQQRNGVDPLLYNVPAETGSRPRSPKGCHRVSALGSRREPGGPEATDTMERACCKVFRESYCAARFSCWSCRLLRQSGLYLYHLPSLRIGRKADAA